MGSEHHPSTALQDQGIGAGLSELAQAGVVPAGSVEDEQRGRLGRSVLQALDAEVAGLRTREWLPTEICRLVGRTLGARYSAIAAASVQREWRAGGDQQLGGAWATELAELPAAPWDLDPASPSWREQLEAAARLAAFLRQLPGLPAVAGALVGPHRSGGDEHRRVLGKVRALLAKAESTEYPDEAAALTEKAQALLSRHNLDAAALEAADLSSRPPAASVLRVWIDEPYVRAKGYLLHVVAHANRCRCVLSTALGLATVVGHDDDLDTVDLLFTSLLVQATTQLTAAGSRTDRLGRSRTRAFRHSFLVAFASRIGQRLREIARADEEAASQRHGGALLPVLATRRTAADEMVEALFAGTERRSTRATDPEGWERGTRAAEVAALPCQAGLEGGP